MDVAQRPILNQVLHHVYGWAVNKGVAGHECASLRFRQFDEFFGKARAVGKWFFDHHMLATPQSFARQFEMRGDWGCNHHRVHAVPKLIRRREAPQRRIRAEGLAQASWIGITARDELTFLRLVQGPREIGPPVTVTDQSDSHVYPAFARELRRACSFFAFDTTTASRNCDWIRSCSNSIFGMTQCPPIQPGKMCEGRKSMSLMKAFISSNEASWD